MGCSHPEMGYVVKNDFGPLPSPSAPDSSLLPLIFGCVFLLRGSLADDAAKWDDSDVNVNDRKCYC